MQDGGNYDSVKLACAQRAATRGKMSLGVVGDDACDA